MKVCLFDIDGTLLHTGSAGKEAIVHAYREVTQQTDLPGTLHLSGKTDRGIFRELFGTTDLAASETVWEQFIDIYLDRLASNLPIRQGFLLPGVESLLGKISQREDMLLGLLTGNVKRGAELKLSHYGIAQYFLFGGFGDDHPQRDDVARSALAAAENHYGGRLITHDVYVIGDTPADVACARAIGAQSIAVATGVFSLAELESTSPDLLLNNLSDWEAVASFLSR